MLLARTHPKQCHNPCSLQAAPTGASTISKWLLPIDRERTTHTSPTVVVTVGWRQVTSLTACSTHQWKLSMAHRESTLLLGTIVSLANVWPDSTKPQTGQILPTTGKESHCRWLDWRKNQQSHKSRAHTQHTQEISLKLQIPVTRRYYTAGWEVDPPPLALQVSKPFTSHGCYGSCKNCCRYFRLSPFCLDNKAPLLSSPKKLQLPVYMLHEQIDFVYGILPAKLRITRIWHILQDSTFAGWP